MIARALLACLLLAASAAAAAGAEVPVGRRAHALASDLMSPYCPGRTLSDCPSPDAAVVRQEIRTRLDAGQSEAEIRGDLEERFGGAVRGVPTSLLGWLLPIAILALGACALGLALRRLLRRQGERAAAAAPPELERDLDRQLRERGL